MSAAGIPIRPRNDLAIDIGTMWRSAIEDYEKTIMAKITSLPKANNVDELVQEMRLRERKFTDKRHDASQLDKFRSLVKKSLFPIEKLSGISASTVSSVRRDHR
jgi:fungal STAND N-terminal Goodbye domain